MVPVARKSPRLKINQHYKLSEKHLLNLTPTHKHTNVGRPAKADINQLCADTGYRREKLPRGMAYRDGWCVWEREREREREREESVLSTHMMMMMMMIIYICNSLLRYRKSFEYLNRMLMGDETWILYNNKTNKK